MVYADVRSKIDSNKHADLWTIMVDFTNKLISLFMASSCLNEKKRISQLPQSWSRHERD